MQDNDCGGLSLSAALEHVDTLQTLRAMYAENTDEHLALSFALDEIDANLDEYIDDTEQEIDEEAPEK